MRFLIVCAFLIGCSEEGYPLSCEEAVGNSAELGCLLFDSVGEGVEFCETHRSAASAECVGGVEAWVECLGGAVECPESGVLCEVEMGRVFSCE